MKLVERETTIKFSKVKKNVRSFGCYIIDEETKIEKTIQDSHKHPPKLEIKLVT